MDHEYTFPKWVYHQTMPPKVIYTGVELDALKREGWASNPSGPFPIAGQEPEQGEHVDVVVVEPAAEPKRRGRPRVDHGNR